MSESIEARRRKNIEDNKRILKEIGLLNTFNNFKPRVTLKTGIQRKRKATEQPRQAKYQIFEDTGDEVRGSIIGRRRRSARISGAVLEDIKLQDLAQDDEEQYEKKTPKIVRPMCYGPIDGVEVGASWETRMECSKDGVHRVTVAGIHGGPDGAYSIALSGGYDDNIDMGDCFTYTGEGGRDLKGTKNNPKNLRTAPQSKDQVLSKGNLGLQKSVETGNPVRVIRGYKLTSAFAPEDGYRYDGLYTVQKAWYTLGSSGFGVWKFALKRMEGQAPPPWTITELDAPSQNGHGSGDDSDSKQEQNGKASKDKSKNGNDSEDESMAEQNGKDSDEESTSEQNGKVSDEESTSEQNGKVSEEESTPDQNGIYSKDESKAEQNGKASDEESTSEQNGIDSKDESTAEQNGKDSEDESNLEENGKVSDEESTPEQNGKTSEEDKENTEGKNNEEEMSEGDVHKVKHTDSSLEINNNALMQS